MVRVVIKDEDFQPVLYTRLGVAPDATDAEIKKAYRRIGVERNKPIPIDFLKRQQNLLP